jgi:hypothetical protein
VLSSGVSISDFDSRSGRASTVLRCILLRVVILWELSLLVVAEGRELVFEHVVVDCFG